MIQLFRYLGQISAFIAIIKDFRTLWKDVKEILLERNLSVSNKETTEVDTKLLNVISRGDELCLKAKLLL